MSLHDDLDGRRALRAALEAGALVAFAFVAFGWLRLSLTGGTPAGNLVGILGAGAVQAAVATVTFAPFLLAVVGVVARPTPRVVAGGVALVYGVDLLVTLGTTLATGFPGSVGPAVLVVPLSTVVSLLAIAAAVWLAYHGGYDRLAAAAEGADRHPLFANLPGARLGPELSVKRGLVAAGLAALVGAGGMVAANWAVDLIRAATRAGAGGSVSVTVSGPWVWNVGIPPAQFPAEWLSEASFLLAVLFVAGPRVAARDLGKGIAVIVGVQSAAVLVPALVAPVGPLDPWAPSGPILAPLGDVFLFVGVAVAVRLALHDGGPVRALLDRVVSE